jgi:hypothetical protein
MTIKKMKDMVRKMDFSIRVFKAKENNNFKGLTVTEINYLIEQNEIIELPTADGNLDIEWLLPHRLTDNKIINNLPEIIKVKETEENNLPF